MEFIEGGVVYTGMASRTTHAALHPTWIAATTRVQTVLEALPGNVHLAATSFSPTLKILRYITTAL